MLCLIQKWKMNEFISVILKFCVNGVNNDADVSILPK